MIVRPVSEPDRERCIELGRALHAEGSLAFVPFSDERASRLLRAAVQNPERVFLWVAEDEGQIIGMRAGVMEPYWFAEEKDGRLASGRLFYVIPERRGGTAAVRLAHAYIEWAKKNGATEIEFSTSSGIRTEQTERFYSKLGGTYLGGIYKIRVESMDGGTEGGQTFLEFLDKANKYIAPSASLLSAGVGLAQQSGAFGDASPSPFENPGNAPSLPVAPPLPTSFARPQDMDAPPTFKFGPNLTSLQKRAQLATYGSQGNDPQYRSGEAANYYKNQLMRDLIDDQGNLADFSKVLPVEERYLKQMGYDFKPDTLSLLQALSR